MAINFQPVYVLASGGERALEQIDVTTNNLANVNTTGFKKLVMTELSQYLPQNKGQKKHLLVFPRFKDAAVINIQGSIVKTGKPLDIAIEGKGYFQVMTPSGDILLTRNGHFFFNNAGYLVDGNGNYVLNISGAKMKLNTLDRVGTNIYINEEGKIFQGNEDLGIIGIVNYDNVKPLGNSYYKPAGKKIPAEYTILQGFLENSNVNVVEEMVDLINNQRRMEIYSNLMKGLDNIEQKTNEIGRA